MLHYEIEYLEKGGVERDSESEKPAALGFAVIRYFAELSTGSIYLYHHLSLNLQGDQNHGHFSNFGLLSSGHFANSEPKQFVFNGRSLL